MIDIQKKFKNNEGEAVIVPKGGEIGQKVEEVTQDQMIEDVFADNPQFVLENIDQILEDLPEVSEFWGMF